MTTQSEFTQPELPKRNPAFHECTLCHNIAEYSQLVGTNPQDVDTIYWCTEHAMTHMDISELEEHHLEEFDYMVKTTFEWVSGGVETRIPIGYEEEHEREKKSWEDFKRANPS